ncbi:hypothetical protein K469DRAFT_162544 [Zopfia rhizophila CBS 207.26]|uniref:Uncharacterized protein n=1 Tax=Zopfia rhizophila CBS 207.26 TaxID=1314779 RepID=A0A6A6E4T0_9PEZI|nr:hypothetical protein K469DRAFT_162544 [Zopfia rhizophila CBS 207.26]
MVACQCSSVGRCSPMSVGSGAAKTDYGRLILTSGLPCITVRFNFLSCPRLRSSPLSVPVPGILVQVSSGPEEVPPVLGWLSPLPYHCVQIYFLLSTPIGVSREGKTIRDAWKKEKRSGKVNTYHCLGRWRHVSADVLVAILCASWWVEPTLAVTLAGIEWLERDPHSPLIFLFRPAAIEDSCILFSSPMQRQ